MLFHIYEIINKRITLIIWFGVIKIKNINLVEKLDKSVIIKRILVGYYEGIIILWHIKFLNFYYQYF